MIRTVDYFVDTGFSDISFVNIGQQDCSPKHAYGPLSQDKYLVHIIFKGKGYVSIDGREYHLEQGNYFYFKPNEVTYYEADQDEPWHYFWFGFNLGDSFEYIGDMIDEIGVVKKIDIFEEKAEELTQIDYSLVENSLNIQSRLLELLDLFLENIQTKSTKMILSPQTAYGQQYSELFCRKVRLNYWNKDLTIESIAEEIGLTSSYFSSIIRSELNQSPSNYLMNYRLEKGERYIMHTNQSISDIAYLVGYKNINNFSRSFKLKYGLSPSNYRKKYQKIIKNMEVKND